MFVRKNDYAKPFSVCIAMDALPGRIGDYRLTLKSATEQNLSTAIKQKQKFSRGNSSPGEFL